MTFRESVSTCFRKYAVFHGRASRSEFWYFSLFLTVMTWSAFLIDIYRMEGFMVFSTAFFLVSVLPRIGVIVRRLHDIERRGWWFMALPAGWSFVVFGTLTMDELIGRFGVDRFVLSIVAAIIAAIWITVWFTVLVWFLRKGTDGPNRYGEDPLAEPEEELEAITADA